MKNLKSRNQFLSENVKYKKQYELLTEAGIQSNNSKWSETMIGKLFNFVIRNITLNGYLVDKFKDALGAKSFLIKNLAKRLEKTIDKLPGEYIDKKESIDDDNFEMSFYLELMNSIEALTKSKNISINKVEKELEKSILNLDNLSLELNSSNDNHKELISDIKNKVKTLNKILDKIYDMSSDLNETEKENEKIDLSKMSSKIGDRSDIKRKYEDLKSIILNIVSKEKDSVKISTKSMFEIISILNKARSIYMEEDTEGETIFRGNKKETVFNPNRRLFDLWEEKVLAILGRKNSIIPKELLGYINNSLASVDPVKYNFEVEKGVEKNILDQLSDIDRAIDKIDNKFNKKNIVRDVIMPEKSNSENMLLKDHERIAITQDTLVRGLIYLKASAGNSINFNETGDDTETSSFDDKALFFLPTRTYVNGLVLGILSYSPEVFNRTLTKSGNKIDINKLNLNSNDFWRNDSHFYWAVLNKKDISLGENFVIRLFNPGSTITKDRLYKMDKESLYESVVFNKLGEIKALYGEDTKVVEIEKNYINKKFNISSSGYRSVDSYFHANKF